MSSLTNVTAVILCGGKGTRSWNVLPEGLPKCLAPVAGRPFLFYILDHLRDQGVRNIVLCTGYGKDTIWKSLFHVPAEVHIGNWDGFVLHSENVTVRDSSESEPLGTGGALRNALPLLDSDPVLVLNGDTYCKFDLGELLREYEEQKVETLDLCVGDIDSTSSGVRLLSRRFIEGIRPPDSLERILGWQIGEEDHYEMLVPGLKFHDIGTPEGYAGAEAFLREQGVIK